MRSLHILGIAENGGHLVCVDAEPGDAPSETFALPLDERLRAAVRGDLTRFGQLEIEMAPQLRPREIQSRIRAGASIEQVAAAAGCSPERIERYAYPVLMERTTIADRARRVRPLSGAAMGSTGAARADRTLEEIVSGTLADRGQQQDVSWDAFRDERGWTVTVTWRAGRSENRAEWVYHTGPDGGSVAARNDAAADLVEPAPRPLHTIELTHRGGDGHRNRDGHQSGDGDRNRDAHRGRRATGRNDAEPTSGGTPTGPDAAPVRGRAVDEYLVTSTVTDDRSGALPPAGGSRSAPPEPANHAATAARTGTDGPSSAPSRSDTESGPERPTAGRAAKRGHRPPMPSWEDVLLGTRASGR